MGRQQIAVLPGDLVLCLQETLVPGLQFAVLLLDVLSANPQAHVVRRVDPTVRL
jgi:hypothetical protein